MTTSYAPSKATQIEQRARRLKGTAKGYWYSAKGISRICIICSMSIAFFLSSLGALWISATFMIDSYKFQKDMYHVNNYYAPIPYTIQSKFILRSCHV